LFHWCSLLLLSVQGIQGSITQHYKILKIKTSQQTLKESDIEEDWFWLSSCYKLSSRHLLDGISCNVAFHEYNYRKIQFWHLGNANTFNIEIIEWRLTSSPLLLDEW
jgi:hypothetical protein